MSNSCYCVKICIAKKILKHQISSKFGLPMELHVYAELSQPQMLITAMGFKPVIFSLLAYHVPTWATCSASCTS